MKRRARLIGPLALVALVILLRLGSPPLLADVSFSNAITDRDQRLLRLTLSKDEKYRLWVPLGRISPAVIEATLAKEDRYFRYHPGVNPIAIGRALWSTFVSRDRRLGASTITMQLVRLRHGIRSRTAAGKVRQILSALWLEARYSKNEILQAYLNLAPYGLNIEGIGAASRIFFQKPAYRIDAAEAKTLALLPQSPGRIKRPGSLSPVGGLPWDLRLPSRLPFLAPHFVDDLLQRGVSLGEIQTTLSLTHQRMVERQVRRWVERKQSIGITNAVALVVDAKDMEVLAWVGSANYFNADIDGQVDGVSAFRSPGSTLKPLLYGLALDQGIIHPSSLLKDAPARFGAQNPENSDHDFAGPISATEALNRSRNIPALWLNGLVTQPSLFSFLKSAGLPRLKDEAHYGLGIALGNAEMSMEKLAELYAILASGGKHRPLRRLKDDPRVAGETRLSPEAAALVLEMLEQNPRVEQGYLSRLTRNGQGVAWKTGTSFAFRDAWSVGVVGRYVIAVWAGNFDGRGNPAFVGRDAAAPLLFSIIDSLSAEPGIPPRALPDTKIASVRVCALSGHLPGPHCHRHVSASFIPGTSPITRCEIHREVVVDTRTGKQTCAAGSFAKSQVYEYWPSDLLRLFRLAGIARRVPPAADASCPLDARASRGLAPEITSPGKSLQYHVRVEGQTDNIPLSATVDADVSLLHWFVGSTYLGRSLPSEPFFWKASPGDFTVRVVDNHGRSAHRALTVRVER